MREKKGNECLYFLLRSNKRLRCQFPPPERVEYKRRQDRFLYLARERIEPLVEERRK